MMAEPRQADGQPSKEAGFTLVEILVAMFIFAIISAGTLSAMTTSLRGQDVLNQSVEKISDFQGARAMMKSDMTHIILRSIRDELGAFEPFVLTTDREALLIFSRSGRENPGGLEKRGDQERVHYVFEDGKLIRRSWSVANPVEQTPVSDRILFDDVTDIDLYFRLAALPDSRTNRLNIKFSGQGIEAANIPDMVQFDITQKGGIKTAHIFELDIPG